MATMIKAGHVGTTHIDGFEVHLECHGDPTAACAQKIAVVGVVPFTPAGEIVAVAVDRGIDLPSGHVETSDTSPEEAARREAWEEANIRLGELLPVACFRVIADDDRRAGRHVAIYTTVVTDMVEFIPTGESSARLVLTPDVFAARYRPDEAPLLRAVVAEARQRLAAQVGEG